MRALFFLPVLLGVLMLRMEAAHACDCMCMLSNHAVTDRSERRNAADCVGYCQWASYVTHRGLIAAGACMTAGGHGGGRIPDNVPIHVTHYRDGCIAWFLHSTYFSPDCQNLSGGGQTKVAWPGEYRNVRAFVTFNDCVITAFSGGGIYKSCNGLNLGGGGSTKKLYDKPNPVTSMTVTLDGKLRTVFSHPGECYLDPSGDYPAGGPGVTHC